MQKAQVQFGRSVIPAAISWDNSRQECRSYSNLASFGKGYSMPGSVERQVSAGGCR